MQIPLPCTHVDALKLVVLMLWPASDFRGAASFTLHHQMSLALPAKVTNLSLVWLEKVLHRHYSPPYCGNPS